jgi:hypothetical protein
MTVRDLFVDDLVLLASSVASKAAATTTAFDFGTPNDIVLATLADYPHDGRLIVVFTATTAGTTNTIAFSVQDAPDSSGSIGSVATAVTDGTLTGGTGNQHAYTTVQVQAGRPWIRCNLTGNGTTDTFACTCMVFALRRGA